MFIKSFSEPFNPEHGVIQEDSIPIRIHMFYHRTKMSNIQTVELSLRMWFVQYICAIMLIADVFVVD